jgi:hypothetical protein
MLIFNSFGIKATISQADRENLSKSLAKYDGFSNFAAVSKDGMWGFIDKTGKEVIPCIYDMVYLFSDGFAKVEQSRRSGFVDKTGNEVFPCIFNEAESFSDGLASVLLGNAMGYIDKEGYFIGRDIVKKPSELLK